MDNLVRNGVAHLNILGKEPLLYPGIVQFVEHARAQGLQVSLTTNGTVGDTTTLARLAALDISGIFFSLDGPTPSVNDRIRGKGVFDAVTRSVDLFIEYRTKLGARTKVTVNTVLMRLNSDAVPDMLDVCACLGADAFNLLRLEHLGRAASGRNGLHLTPEEQFCVAERTFSASRAHPGLAVTLLSVNPLYLEYFHKRCGVESPVRVSGCRACRREIYIDPCGTVSPCLSTSPTFVHEQKAPYAAYACEPAEYAQKPIASLPMFDAFQKEFPLDRASYAEMIPCDRCPYVTTLCFPCPLPRGRQRTEPLCAIAYSRGVEHGFWS